MKKFKKMVAFLLAAIMVMGVLAACSKKAEEQGNDKSGNVTDSAKPTVAEEKGEDAEATEEANPYTEHLKFTLSAVDAEKAGLTESGEVAANFKWICDKFNVEFEFWPLTWANYVDQTRMWLNSDSAPDLIMLDVAPVRYSEYLDWVEAGLFRAYPNLDDYPNMKMRYDKMTTGKKFAVDGQLYAWPSYMDSDKYNFVQGRGYTYRKDWAQAVGLYKEDEIYTWDEWQTLVRTVIAQDPGKNGAGKTIGMMCKSNWEFPKYIVGDISPYLLSFKQDQNGTWAWGPTLPESLEAIKAVKQMYDEGLIWSDQPMVTDNDFENNFSSGKLFSAVNSNTTVSGLRDIADKWSNGNPDLKPQDCISVATVLGPDGKLLAYQSGDQWSQTAMNHNLSDEKAARWVDILEFLVSDEGYLFRTFGIQDVDWKYAADGSVECLWAENADGVRVNPYNYGNVWTRPGGLTDGFALISPARAKWQQDLVRRAWERASAPDTKLIPLNVEFAFFTTPAYDAAVAGLEAETYAKIAELMTSKDIVTDWTNWVNQKAAEVQPAVDELNANLK